MAQDSWLKRINPFKTKDSEAVQKLRAQLDDIIEESHSNEAGTLEAHESYKGLGSELSGYLSKAYKTKSPDTGIPAAGQASGEDSMIDLDALQRVFIQEPWVYNSVMAVAETVASIPIKLEKSVKVKKEVLNEITGVKESILSEVWIPATAEKLAKIYNNPNPETTASEFYMLLIIDLLTTGEYFIWLESKKDIDLGLIESRPEDDNVNTPFGHLRQVLAGDTPVKHMWRVPPSIIAPVVDPETRKVEGYQQVTEDSEHAYSKAEIIHVKYPNPQDYFRGLAPLVPMFKSILIDRYQTEHMIRFYKSGARLGGVIETEKNLNKEGLGRFQRSFENNYTGKQNHHRTLILPPGMTYRTVESDPATGALLEFAKYNRETILATYRVPPIKVGLTDGQNFANSRSQLETYFSDCIKPKLKQIADGFNNKASLMPDGKTYRMTFDLTEVPEAQDDLAQKAGTGTAMLASGLTVNEVRKLHWKVEPVEDGDVIIPLKGAAAPAPNPMGGFPLALSTEPSTTKAPEEVAPSDVTPTAASFTDRVNALAGQLVQSGVPLALAIPQAIEQARLEGFTDEPVAEDSGVCAECSASPCSCPPDDSGKALSLSEFISEALAKLDPSEKVDANLINELVSIFNGETKEEIAVDSTAAIAPDTAPEVIAPVTLRAENYGYTKEILTEMWKDAMGKADPLIEKRLAEVRKFFKQFQTVALNRLGANIKAYGMHKAGDNEDINDILKLDAYDAAIDDYIKAVDAALQEAYQGGYNSILGEFKFGDPNEAALKFLKEYAAKNVKLITDTTMEQLRLVLSEAFEQGLAIGDVSEAIRGKFVEIDQGRAVTIARTETLTAVSAGQEAKTQDVIKEYPEKKLMKAWVSSQDAFVRDSHANVDGEVVEVDKAFSNGLQYPREAGAPAAEVINCRCTRITFAAEDESAISDTLNPSEE